METLPFITPCRSSTRPAPARSEQTTPVEIPFQYLELTGAINWCMASRKAAGQMSRHTAATKKVIDCFPLLKKGFRTTNSTLPAKLEAKM